MDTKQAIGERLGDILRQARGKRTQAQVAEAIGTTISMVSKYENGHTVPSLDGGQFFKVCDGYGVRPSRVINAIHAAMK
jgi:transcriptional regulator with XRE-family HTH domain